MAWILPSELHLARSRPDASLHSGRGDRSCQLRAAQSLPAVPRRALRIGRQRSPTDNHGRCSRPPSCSISPSGADRGASQARGWQSAWSALGPHGIRNRWSSAGTNGQPRYVRITGHAPIGALTSGGKEAGAGFESHLRTPGAGPGLGEERLQVMLSRRGTLGSGAACDPAAGCAETLDRRCCRSAPQPPAGSPARRSDGAVEVVDSALLGTTPPAFCKSATASARAQSVP